MACGDNDNSCGVDFASLPLLDGCPGDSEQFLVRGAEGGLGTGKYARRTWANIKACAGSSSTHSFYTLDETISVEGNTYQNNSIIGCTELKIMFVDTQYNSIERGDFTVDTVTGTITWNQTFFAGSNIGAQFNKLN